MPEPGLDTRLMAKTPASLRRSPVLACIGVVPGEDVLLDAHEVMRMSRGPFVVMMIVVRGLIVVVVMLALMAATAYAAHWSFSSG